MRPIYKFLQYSAPIALLCTGFTGTAYADTMVVSSSGPSANQYPAGRALVSNTRIVLKDGDVLKILDSKGTRILRGPNIYSAEAIAGVATNTSFSALITAKPRSRIGGVRGPTGQPTPPTIWLLDMDKSTTFCLPSASSALLWRPSMEKTITVGIRDDSTGTTSTVRFMAGAHTANWPVNTVPIREGISYTVTQPDKTEPTQIRFSIGITTPDPVHTYTQLDQHGCMVQRDLFTEAMTPHTQKDNSTK